MAADVSSLARMMSGRELNESGGGKSTAPPITRDLLGGCCSLDSKELDLDLQVPSGWEKRLDLKSGKVYLERSNSSLRLGEKKNERWWDGKMQQDLNFPPSSSLSPSSKAGKVERTLLELKLVNSAPQLPPCQQQQLPSVCTLEKVKSALERVVEKEESSSSSGGRKRAISLSNSSSSPPLSHSRDYYEVDLHQQNASSSSHCTSSESAAASSSFAAGCPCCLLYVIISKSSPRCPRCNTIVTSPTLNNKKPRIDLNISI
ncbi:unnamed protein product [Cuscuta epithymum]|uniref:GIR1-like zinc ribbon domain-containing protein n=1 Tax=Cuscuta epithymum TaxID=186058 RepID=A0AAV0BZM4_9ASTE|nr:unnamed protein product [Cuscuta epithymum]